MNLDALIDRILEREGGFVNRAEDRGGPTNWGITLATLTEERGPVTLEDIKALTAEEARRIYHSRYITAPNFDKISSEALLELVVDSAVNNGRARATRWLQRAASVLEDGILGPVSLAAINAKPALIWRKFYRVRLKHYGALISSNHAQAIFAAGWMNRLAEFVLECP